MQSDALFHFKQLFYQANYNQIITANTPADQDLPHITLLQARSHLALLPPNPTIALDLLSSLPEPTSDIKAFQLLASYIQQPAEDHLDGLRDLLIELEDGDQEDFVEEAVKVAAATAFLRAGEKEEAVDALSSQHESLECSSILVQIYLSINRLDLAKKVYEHAKTFGEDSLLVQQIEAWLTLRSQGPTLQQAYYFYDEILLGPTGRQPTILAGHGAAHYLLGHKEEAEGDLQAAVKLAGEKEGEAAAYATAVAVLNKPDVVERLRAVDPSHPLVLDLAAKELAFDEAAAKFAIAV